jgi:replicative superfamily II helicase
LSLNVRQIIEEAFKINAIKIIRTTSTLSQGVNLPVRLVIIKSTNCYKGHNIVYSEYTKIEIGQMCGHAGRPHFDNKGIAVIMTESYKTNKFEGISNEKIESHLKANIHLYCIFNSSSK